jgi:hypothetical protein
MMVGGRRYREKCCVVYVYVFAVSNLGYREMHRGPHAAWGEIIEGLL